MPAPFGQPTDRERNAAEARYAPTPWEEDDGSGRGQDGRGASRGKAEGAIDELVPTLSLPRGGGAIRGMGETFEVQSFTGSASLGIPIPTPDARGRGPQLTLTYGAGSGNGPFGLGFQLSPRSIGRKTDRGLPRYRDHEESDVFVLSGAEDLVPTVDEAGPIVGPGELLGRAYTVHRYRPRIEQDFSRIERWVDGSDHTSFWRVTSPDNVVSYFGRTENSRVFDPESPRRIFQWLLDRVEDDRGNASDYVYKAEDDAGVRVSDPWERGRRRGAGPQRYLKRIRYGNRVPPSQPGAVLEPGQFTFEVVLDYGEHGAALGFDEPEHAAVAISHDETQPWAARPDPFSTFRPGFELRTRRLCQRVLVFHRFAQLGPQPVLTNSIDLTYETSPVTTLLRAATRRGYVRNDDGTYRARALPPLQLEYTSAQLQPRLLVDEARGLEDIRQGLDGSALQLVDLDGEGAPGLLWVSDRTWAYKRAVGDATFAPAEILDRLPSVADGQPRLLDLDGSGRLALTELSGPMAGTFARRADGGWDSHRPLESKPTIDLADPRVRMLDVDGDGLTDILVDRGDELEWYPSLGVDGFGPGVRVAKPLDEVHGPQLVYEDPQVAIFHADMTGDGLADLVRVEDRSVVYWPNRGFGQFGPRVVMGDVPPLGHSDTFSAQRVRLGDIDGSGTSDLVVFDERGAFVCLNAAGNRFMPPTRVRGVPPVTAVDHADIADIDGRGVGSLVWSSSLATESTLQVVRLLEAKPYLLRQVDNGIGGQSRIGYAPSTEYYLSDRRAGRPWATRLPFPVQVVERVETLDQVTGHRTVTTYAYHHGYFDGVEREFRGFGLVEQRDTESFAHFGAPGLFDTGHRIEDEALHVPPMLTRTWFHTGAYLGRDSISRQLAGEYWRGDPLAVEDPEAFALPDTVLPAGLDPAEAREAVRALKGTALRQEVYAEDGSALAAHPYTMAETTMQVRLEQTRGERRHAVFLVHEREMLTLQYERRTDDPRISHGLVLHVDDFGVVRRRAEIAYPRRVPQIPEQAQATVVLTAVDVEHQAFGSDRHRLGVPYETRAYEVTGLSVSAVPFSRLTADDLAEDPEAAVAHRLLSSQRTYYYDDALTGPLPLGQAGLRVLPFEQRAAAFTPATIAEVFGADLDEGLLTEGGHELADGLWWTRSRRQVFDPGRFFLPIEVRDPIERGHSPTLLEYEADLFVNRVTDPHGNVVQAEIDRRVLAPWRVTDLNGNVSEAAFDELGLAVAVALRGKPLLDEGDTLEEPTARIVYDAWAWYRGDGPTWARVERRETHRDPQTRWLVSLAYTDGMGGVVQRKAQAEPGPVPHLGAAIVDPRWVATGRTIRNNKGNPVKQYEPYFSATDAFEDEAALVEQGVTAILHYDPLGRLIRTDFPDGTFSRVEFDPWRQLSFDANDTAGESSWHAERMALPAGDPHRRAAEVTIPHHDTPTVTHLDHLGRPVRVVVHNRRAGGPDQFQETRTVLDVQGNVLEVVDARLNAAETRTYGMLGQALRVASHDAGTRRSITNVLGRPLRSFDNRGQVFRADYDALWRPTHQYVQDSEGIERLVTRTVYGESLPSPQEDNLRGQVARIYDSAGAVTSVAFDFKGALLRSERRLASVYTETPDWTATAALDDPAAIDTAAAIDLDEEVFGAEATWDALGRPVTQTAADGTVTEVVYNEAGLLESVQARIRGAVDATVVVTNIDYDVRGRRASISYGNGTSTAYTYDPLTLRLTRLHATRASDGAALQDLRYVHDPVGNIVEINDLAQQTVYFANAQVEPLQRFTYDATYQLATATGREHASQGQPVSSDLTPGLLPDPNDPAALRGYTETYQYDPVGNITELQHVGGPGWTRVYQYDAAGNRLLATSAPDDPLPPGYAYDPHGNMTAMPHLAAIDYDHADRMQYADLGGGGAVWFVYDSAGNRVRKVRVNQAGAQTEERIYLGGVELYRERQGGVLRLERQTVHLADDTGRICLVEAVTVDEGAPLEQPANVARYQYGNHLGTVSLELDEAANTISYEEYHPYGTTAYRAVDASIQVSAKRYRYTGRERDEETGLDHMGARYYASWLGRWTAADPIGLGDGVNRYAYVGGNPVRFIDIAGTQRYEKTSWGDYMVGVNTPIGKQQRKAKDAAAFARAEADVLAELKAVGASEDEISLQRETVAELQAAAFRERVVLDLAAGDPDVSERIAASGMSIDDALDLGARAGAISHAQIKAEERFQAEGAAKTVYMTPSGNFTDAQLTARRQVRELNVVTGPTAGAIAYAGGNGVSLETAEGIQAVEGMAGSLAPALRHVTGRNQPAPPPPKANSVGAPRTPPPGGGGGGGSGGPSGPGGPFVPEEHWQKHSPRQVTPGTRRLDHRRVSGRTGQVEDSRVIYDEFGRQSYRVDKTDHMRPTGVGGADQGHSNPHLHETTYAPKGARGHNEDTGAKETLHNLRK